MPADSLKRGEIHRSPLSGAILCDFAADAEAAEQLLVGRVLTTGPGAQYEGLVPSDAQRQPGDAQDLSGDRK